MKRSKTVLQGVEIQDVAAEGKAIARLENRVVFVPMVVPGDVVDILITRKRKSYWEGKVLRLVKASDLRIDPVCEHFGICGGCKWQMLPYHNQLEYKQRQVSDQLRRIGHLELPEINQILGSEHSEFYRNKLEYTFSHRKWYTSEEMKDENEIVDVPALGFHVRGLFDKVVDVNKCWLQRDPSNQIRDAVKKFSLEHGYTFFNLREQRGFLRNLIVRTTTLGELMVILSFHEDQSDQIGALMSHLNSSFPQITSLLYVINPKANDTILDLDILIFEGRDHIFEEMDGIQFKIGPKSFFQSHSTQAVRLYRRVLEMAGLTGNETVYDLYTGTGTIAIFLARHCKKVIGIESVPEAIHDAKVNSDLNQIRNCEFFTGDMKEVLNESFINDHGKPDVIVLDPPRSGIHPFVAESILFSKPERIVYVSCNPATQARDLNLLSQYYKLTEVQPVDMFPHTHHVENIVRLDIR